MIEGQTADIKVYRDATASHSSYGAFQVDYSTYDTTHYGFAASAKGSGQFSQGSDYDYISGSGTLSFAQNEMEKTITVTGIPIPGSNNPTENDEYFFVELFNGRGSGVNVQIHQDSTHSVLIVEPS